MKPRILLVEDEENILETIKLNLEFEGYDVETASDGELALNKTKSERFDLIVLDIMLPRLDGFAVCQAVRKTDSTTPILFLSAKNTVQDKIAGLKMGGDDYLTKPFNLEEFLLRVQILLKRSAQLKDINLNDIDVFSFGQNSIYFSSYEIETFRGERKQLPVREIKLLKFMIDHKNKVVSRDDILDSVWGHEAFPTSRTIDNYILVFRKYFEEDPRSPRFFHSIRGVGYKFTD